MADLINSKAALSKDIRTLNSSEVCDMRTWLTSYMRMENAEVTDSKQLLNILVKNSREYESDLGVFGVED